MWSIINRVRRIYRIGVLKTLYINFLKLPFQQAIKLPIIVARNTYLYDISGKIVLTGKISTGIIRIGFFGEDTHVWKNDRVLIKIKGTLICNGKLVIGVGASVRVENNSQLIIGDDVVVGQKTKIICYQSITIGSHTRIAWESQLIDTNFHFMRNVSDLSFSDLTKKIVIGEHNWIGNRSNIMKGAVTPNYCIIASSSLINRDNLFPSYSIVAGVPVKLVKEGYYRVLEKEEAELRKEFNIPY